MRHTLRDVPFSYPLCLRDRSRGKKKKEKMEPSPQICQKTGPLFILELRTAGDLQGQHYSISGLNQQGRRAAGEAEGQRAGRSKRVVSGREKGEKRMHEGVTTPRSQNRRRHNSQRPLPPRLRRLYRHRTSRRRASLSCYH